MCKRPFSPQCSLHSICVSGLSRIENVLSIFLRKSRPPEGLFLAEGCKQRAKYEYDVASTDLEDGKLDNGTPLLATNTTEEGINSAEFSDRVLASRPPGEVEPLET